MTNHEMLAAALKGYRNKILSTNQVIEITLEAFPQFSEGSILPNDHAEGNKCSCSCAGTKDRLFDKITRGRYRVR